ncbi:hypothetical protein EXIGLDRAFT_347065 [Exidia glandulosa HHB12029]|uniref:Uncharacterized protein n=1 Tax=Exidia glandulosa HHB12029 TaxID=1314781 RepID=A0A165CF95_EXIGL|nr:hypothetical protein EXIGLDRAFT_347065 [Exidia glandulosa HHB12029]
MATTQRQAGRRRRNAGRRQTLSCLSQLPHLPPDQIRPSLPLLLQPQANKPPPCRLLRSTTQLLPPAPPVPLMTHLLLRPVVYRPRPRQQLLPSPHKFLRLPQLMITRQFSIWRALPQTWQVITLSRTSVDTVPSKGTKPRRKRNGSARRRKRTSCRQMMAPDGV